MSAAHDSDVLDRRLRRRRADRGAQPRRDAQGHGARQGRRSPRARPPGRRAGSPRCSSPATRSRAISRTRWSPAPGSTTARPSSSSSSARPRAIERLIELGVPFNHGRRRAAPDARGRAQPPPHRPCRRRDRLGGAAGAAEGRARRIPTSRWSPTWSRSTSSPAATRSAIRARAMSGASMRVDRATGRVELFTARATILATGGAGRTYLFSTAPRGATGDGIAMAWRAGCRVSNMEIHAVPPDLPLQSRGQELPDHRGGARRGRAAQATRRPATASCPISIARAELAPRDIVARAIDHEIKRLGLDYVHLDISHMPRRVRDATISRTSTRSCSGSAST